MQSSLKPIAVGACVSALAAALFLAPASAAPALPTLVLSMQDEHTLIVPDTRTLGCDEYPDTTTGSHPRREYVCGELEKVKGDFAKLEPKVGQNCPMIYDPVTARATGRYKGKRVEFELIYANACVAAAESNDVFRW